MNDNDKNSNNTLICAVIFNSLQASASNSSSSNSTNTVSDSAEINSDIQQSSIFDEDLQNDTQKKLTLSKSDACGSFAAMPIEGAKQKLCRRSQYHSLLVRSAKGLQKKICYSF